MGLQTHRLHMYAVGVAGDAGFDALSHRLVDGIHLRWSFEKRLGFPRHGFHLFRRRSQTPAQRQCLRPGLDAELAGPAGSPVLDTAVGQVSSDAELWLSDEFGWRWSRAVWNVGPTAFDLAGRERLRLTVASALAGQTDGDAPLYAELRLGFRRNVGVVGERVEFWRRPAGAGPNPLIEKGISFRVLNLDGTPRSSTEIDLDGREPPLSGLAVLTPTAFSGLLEVDLPLPATAVFLRLTGMEGSIEGFAPDGRSVASQTWRFAEGAFLSSVSLLSGEPMRRVVVRGLSRLHTFTFETADRTADGIRVTARHGEAEVARLFAQGLERQVITFQLATDYPITAVDVDAGPAVLADLCLLAPGTQGITAGWERIPGLASPVALPVRHPDYPASGSLPVDLAAAQSEALARIRYGPADPWAGTGFDDLHAQLVALVEDGATPPMAQRSTLVPGAREPPRPGPAQPVALRRYPLDSILLAALHPAVAQMVGLYWVDQTAQPGVRYDYLLLAEWRASASPEFASRDPAAVLAKLRRDGLADVDGCIAFEKSLGPPGRPSVPTAVQAFALPGGTMQGSDGAVRRTENVAGLRWDLGKTTSGQLNLDAALLYHVWRAVLGADSGAAPPAADRYRCLTIGRPLLVGGRPPGAPPAQHGNTAWPPFRLHALDIGPVDGWYSYAVSGLDIFGRHSGPSGPAGWRQWAPVPDPRPWYYQDPPGDREIHPFAVRLVDRIPPPPPAAVEAAALDSRDPLLRRDATYDAWRAALAAGERDAVVGLRVRWEWPEALRRQAPDTREFRIYLQTGRHDPAAADLRPATTWAERHHVVKVDEHFTPEVDANGQPVRRYELLLPAAGDAFRGGLNHVLAPSRTDPIAYAIVGVSAADDRDDVPDSPKWAAGRWANRPGNEGPVSPSATVFRILRDTPPVPVPGPDAERVFATRADYFARSFYTYRWRPQDHTRTHVFRTLDDTLFRIDRARRFAADGTPRPDQLTVDPSRLELFPDADVEPRWDAAKRSQVAAELNQLNDLADPIAAAAYYEGLSNDGLRILAGLPSNERAFAQLTIEPLDAADPATANRVGPDNPPDFPIDPTLRAYVDTLDGRAASRYLYRAVTVDGAHNRSPLGLSGPPVSVPDVVPPRPPTVIGVTGAERAITINWASNREPDLAGYRVLRAASAADAEDPRRMVQLAEIAADPDPAARPADVSWTDAPVPGVTDFWYRLVALDRPDPDPRGGGGNASPPSAAVRARATDVLPPAPPVWLAAERRPDATVRLAWRTDEPGVTCIVQRRVPGGVWRPVSERLSASSPPFGFGFVDRTADPAEALEYRLLADDPAGNRTVQDERRAVPAAETP